MKVFDVVVQAVDSGIAQLSLMNQLGMCQRIERGMNIGKAVPVDVLVRIPLMRKVKQVLIHRWSLW